MAVLDFGLLFHLCCRSRLPASLAFQIVRAKPENAAGLTEIAFAAKRHWGYSAELMEEWSAVLTISLGFIVQNATYAAIAEDRTLGFYSLCLEENDQVRLEHLGV